MSPRDFLRFAFLGFRRGDHLKVAPSEGLNQFSLNKSLNVDFTKTLIDIKIKDHKSCNIYTPLALIVDASHGKYACRVSRPLSEK